jgi:ATP-dependent DNA ligase
MTDTKMLYAIARTGKTTTWKAETNYKLNVKGYIEIVATWGFIDGKKQTKIREVKSGKNIGKANETTLIQQADLEIGYLYQSKIDEGMVYDLNQYVLPQNPMLAKPYKKKISKDGYIQRKLNGIRCWIYLDPISNDIVYKSRSGKFFTPFVHITAELKDRIKTGDILDGELFHPRYEFEEISSEVNKETATDRTGFIQFHMYDFVPGTGNVAFKDRYKHIQAITKGLKSVFEVETIFLPDYTEDQIKALCIKWMAEGYEGAMVRDPDALYEFSTSPSHRSDGLLKYKMMFDEEFRILRTEESENEPGQPVFIVVVPVENGTFVECGVRMKGNKEDNTKYLDDPQVWVSKWLCTQYQAKTKYGNLSFPVGLYIREGEVIDGEFVPNA